jgi:ubiquinone biosynthesis monooxygenase Coq7
MQLGVELPDPEFANRVLKVNHAGEHGAVNIYAGQIFVARLTAPTMVGELHEFKSREERHRAIFWSELVRRNQPRCPSYMLCGLGGLMLGLVTGLLGRRAIAATTVAVERVVLRHLAHQLTVLHSRDAAATAAIAAIVEEQQQRDRSAIHSHAGGFWPAILTPVVAASTEVVIWTGMRL